MATTIKLKNSVTTTNAPSSLVQGEVAINITDKKVWVGNAATTPIQLLGGGADGNFTNISVSSVATFGAGTVSAPSITTTGDTNTGIFFPAADTIAFTEGGAEVARIDSSGNVGIGTSSPSDKLHVLGGSGTSVRVSNATNTLYTRILSDGIYSTGTDLYIFAPSTYANIFYAGGAERMRIDSSGNVMVAKTDTGITNVGCVFRSAGDIRVTTNGGECLILNRLTSDGTLVEFYQASALEGTISVSGSTVSYNGGHLARWSQLPDNSKDDTILKGTVMTNLDDMCVWTKDSTVLDNEQLNKMQVSNVEGDTNVAGVFVNWTRDEDCNSDDMNIAMTGDMIIRIAQNVVVQKGDLLMSAGDGTAKPQGDDIVRSKTIAKVTSNHVTCTYEDGSYCVPCVLMAC
jgi:hypothetical protein